jgi:hypothetical protein
VLPSGKVNQWWGKLPHQPQAVRAQAAGISKRQQKNLDARARKALDLLEAGLRGELTKMEANNDPT